MASTPRVFEVAITVLLIVLICTTVLLNPYEASLFSQDTSIRDQPSASQGEAGTLLNTVTAPQECVASNQTQSSLTGQWSQKDLAALQSNAGYLITHTSSVQANPSQTQTNSNQLTDIAEPVWSRGSYFPAFPSTDIIYSINVQTDLDNYNLAWTSSYRISSSADTMAALTLVGMQGIINRNGPKVYLNWISHGNENSSDFWLQLLSRHVNVVKKDLDGLGAIQFLYQLYGSEFAGAVVYDPDVPDTINVATMIAGLDNLVMLAPQQLNAPGIPKFSSVTDLRELVTAQGWDNTENGTYRLYQWVYNNLWPRLEHRIICEMSPGPPTSGEIAEGGFIPLGLAARDYLVALRLPVLWLSPTKEPQASLLTKFLADAPSPIPIIGVFGSQEAESVALYSHHGDWEAAIARDNFPLSGGDLTVLSGVRPALIQYKPDINTDSLFATLGNRSVITIWNSDGDNLQYQLDRGFHGLINWVWEDVQGHKFGWSINPTLAELAPLVWNYYMESSREVSFVSALSGAGFMFPNLMNNTQLKAYLEHTALYMNETGLRSLWVNSWYSSSPLFWNNNVPELYYNVLKNTGYLGAYCPDYSYPQGLGFDYNGVPTPIVFAGYNLNSTNGASIINEILSREPGRYFMDLGQPEAGEYWGQIIKDKDAYGGKAVLFSKSTLTHSGSLAFGTPSMSLAPGNYSVTVRLKVPDITYSQPVAQLYAGVVEEGGDGWRFLARRYISPSEFASAGRYQNFTISFQLYNFTSNVRLRVDYYGGPYPPPGNWAPTELYADFITCDREGNLDLPVFSAVFIPLVTNPQRLTEAPQLAEDFENAGGLTLSPDEFLAALNPEYMVKWATPILGTNNPGLVTARKQLAAGDYLTSLITVRNALRNLPTRNYTAEVNVMSNRFDVTVQANTWITNMGFNQTSYDLSFLTHGPPEGSMHTIIILPNGHYFGPLTVKVDGQSQKATPVKGESYTTIELDLSQGPHLIETIFRKVTNISMHIDPSSVEVGGNLTIAATLKDSDGNPLNNQPVSFSVESTTLSSANTDSSGRAITTYTASMSPGTYTVQASFAVTDNYNSSIGTAYLKINPLPTNITLVIPLYLTQGANTTLTATLNDLKGNPIQGQIIQFVINGILVGTGITNPLGKTTFDYTPSVSGSVQIQAIYQGAGNYSQSSSSIVQTQITAPSILGPGATETILLVIGIVVVIAIAAIAIVKMRKSK